jgi:site-specific recombinase XerD
MSSPARALHLAHFMYLRAYVQGLDQQEAAKRYLGLQDSRRTRAMHQAIVNDLRAHAYRAGETAWRIIGLAAPRSSTQSAAAPPPLEEWAASQGLADWSYAEQLEIYQTAFGSIRTDRRARRNARLVDRQLQLLRKLEALAAAPVLPPDPIHRWLPDDAPRLRLAGLTTMGELALAIASGRRWWRSIPGFGTLKAKRVRAQLEFLCPDGLRAASIGGLVMSRMEALAMSTPQGLTTSDRADWDQPHSSSSAAEDRSAIESWLSTRAGRGQSSLRSYRREAERFLLWCQIERGKSLSAVTSADCAQYRDFLADIPAAWICRHKASRHSPAWTPFRGTLRTSSRLYALGIVQSMLKGLANQGYLAANPLTENVRAADRFAAEPSAAVPGVVTVELWQRLIGLGKAWAPRGAGPRNLFLLEFLGLTGLRMSDLVSARLADVRCDGDVHTMVVQRQIRQEIIPLSADAIAALSRYLATRGIKIPADLDCVDLPLLASVSDPVCRASYASVYSSFREFMQYASTELGSAVPAELVTAGPRWLRCVK